jgi:hypothetical protein
VRCALVEKAGAVARFGCGALAKALHCACVEYSSKAVKGRVNRGKEPLDALSLALGSCGLRRAMAFVYDVGELLG